MKSVGLERLGTWTLEEAWNFNKKQPKSCLRFTSVQNVLVRIQTQLAKNGKPKKNWSVKKPIPKPRQENVHIITFAKIVLILILHSVIMTDLLLQYFGLCIYKKWNLWWKKNALSNQNLWINEYYSEKNAEVKSAAKCIVLCKSGLSLLGKK